MNVSYNGKHNIWIYNCWEACSKYAHTGTACAAAACSWIVHQIILCVWMLCVYISEFDIAFKASSAQIYRMNNAK